MSRKAHVAFLGEETAVTSSLYPTELGILLATNVESSQEREPCCLSG